MGEPLLQVRGLRIEHPRRGTLVREVEFSVTAGECVALVGESGSGKSLTVLALMGLVPPPLQVRGEAVLRGVRGNLLDPAVAARVRGRAMGMVFQEPLSALNPVMRVADQVAEVLAQHRPDLSPRGVAERVAAALAEVQLDPEEFGARFPHQLSGGQRQRVVIAMALAAGPQLLLADEPTTALDVTVQAEIVALLQVLQRRHGMGMVFVSHDLALVAKVASRVVVMAEGTVVEEGEVRSVVSQPRRAETARLLAAQPERLPPRRRPPLGRVLVAAKGVEVHYRVGGEWGWRRPRTVCALSGVDLEVAAGEVVAVVGESGSGKSTLGRVLAGLERPTVGALWVLGRSLAGAPRSAWRGVRRAVQIVFQDPFASLNPKLRVGEQLLEPLTVHGVGRDSTEREAILRQLFQRMGLPEDGLARYPHLFSGGERQRIAVVRALALGPQVLVCDEVTSALDVTVQAELLALLGEWVYETGMGVVWITHNLAVARAFADRVVVLRKGRVVEEGEVRAVLENPQDAYTAQLVAAAPRLFSS